MKDLPLDPITHKYIVGAPLVEGKDHVAQSLAIRLRFFLGEWFLDIFAGVGYYQKVFKKHPKGLSEVEALFKAEIVNTPGVRKLLEFRYDFRKAERTFNFDFVVDTIYGELRGEVQLAQSDGPALPVIVITDNVVVHEV